MTCGARPGCGALVSRGTDRLEYVWGRWAGVIGLVAVCGACSSSSTSATTPSGSTVSNKNAVPNPCQYLPLQDAESILGVEVAAANVVSPPTATNDLCEYSTDYVAEPPMICTPNTTGPNVSTSLPVCTTRPARPAPPSGLSFQLDFARLKGVPTNPGLGSIDGARWRRVNLDSGTRRVRAWSTSVPLPHEKARAHGISVWTPGYLLWIPASGTTDPQVTSPKIAAVVLRNLPKTS